MTVRDPATGKSEELARFERMTRRVRLAAAALVVWSVLAAGATAWAYAASDPAGEFLDGVVGRFVVTAWCVFPALSAALLFLAHAQLKARKPSGRRLVLGVVRAAWPAFFLVGVVSALGILLTVVLRDAPPVVPVGPLLLIGLLVAAVLGLAFAAAGAERYFDSWEVKEICGEIPDDAPPAAPGFAPAKRGAPEPAALRRFEAAARGIVMSGVALDGFALVGAIYVVSFRREGPWELALISVGVGAFGAFLVFLGVSAGRRCDWARKTAAAVSFLAVLGVVALAAWIWILISRAAWEIVSYGPLPARGGLDWPWLGEAAIFLLFVLFVLGVLALLAWKLWQSMACLASDEAKRICGKTGGARADAQGDAS